MRFCLEHPFEQYIESGRGAASQAADSALLPSLALPSRTISPGTALLPTSHPKKQKFIIMFCSERAPVDYDKGLRVETRKERH